jgi:hypothetical protein
VDLRPDAFAHLAASLPQTELDRATELPTCWAAAAPVTVTWPEDAAGYAVMKWPHVTAHTRAGIAGALATITPVLTQVAAGRPPTSVLRAALYGWTWTFNPAGPTASRPLRPVRRWPGRGAAPCLWPLSPTRQSPAALRRR